MNSLIIPQKKLSLLQVNEALYQLFISKIAKKAGIARKTIYNDSHLKERCYQEIQLQEQRNAKKSESTDKGGLTEVKLIEHRYKETRDLLKEEQKKVLRF